MNQEIQVKNRGMEALGETHMSEVNVMATPNPSMRFWIITMLLVLLGLATLKLR